MSTSNVLILILVAVTAYVLYQQADAAKKAVGAIPGEVGGAIVSGSQTLSKYALPDISDPTVSTTAKIVNAPGVVVGTALDDGAYGFGYVQAKATLAAQGVGEWWTALWAGPQNNAASQGPANGSSVVTGDPSA